MTRRTRGATGTGAWALFRLMLATASASAFAFTPGCGGGRGEGLDPRSLPPEVRPDYELFSVRCSKCHSLARPLGSGITDDAFWARYVERMRRQPGSGIAPSDVPAILRFLHHYSQEQRARRGGQ